MLPIRGEKEVVVRSCVVVVRVNHTPGEEDYQSTASPKRDNQKLFPAWLFSKALANQFALEVSIALLL
jgi:hypothetical protein